MVGKCGGLIMIPMTVRKKNMNKEELIQRIQDRLESVDEYFGSEQDDNQYDREYFYGLHDAYLFVLKILGVETDKEYFN